MELILEVDFLQNEYGVFCNATKYLKKHNEANNTNKRFKDFWDNSSTKIFYINLKEQLKIPYLHISNRGVGGSTWMHEKLYEHFKRWLLKVNNIRIERDEEVFCKFIEESFKGILVFQKQKIFGNYRVDLYCEEIHLCIEFDEIHHNKLNNQILDKKRQKEIELEYNVNFIRHNSFENISICINNIIKYKEAYNVVQCIKNNKIPQKGYL